MIKIEDYKHSLLHNFEKNWSDKVTTRVMKNWAEHFAKYPAAVDTRSRVWQDVMQVASLVLKENG